MNPDYMQHEIVLRSLHKEKAHGGHRANQRAASARKDKGKSSPASLRLRGRGQVSDVKSGRVHIVHQVPASGGLAAKDSGNYLLLSLTRRSECCRSGSEISGAGLYERQGAERRCRGVEGCGIRDELIAEVVEVLGLQNQP